MVQSRVCDHIVVVDQGESDVAARGAFDRDRRSSLKGGVCGTFLLVGASFFLKI